jgi:hypothetical protein
LRGFKQENMVELHPWKTPRGRAMQSEMTWKEEGGRRKGKGGEGKMGGKKGGRGGGRGRCVWRESWAKYECGG